MKALLALAIVATACSVPDVSLDGKQCPCASGYVCDTSTNTCRTSSVTDGSGSGGSCLGSDPSGPLYADSFDTGTLDWMHTTAFAETGGQLVQSDNADPLAYATPNITGGAATATQYRIVVTMIGTSGGTGMGVAFRVQGGQKAQYDCIFDPGAATGALVIQEVKVNGQATTLATKAGISDAGPTATYTMELFAQNGTFTCCIDGISAATLTTTSTTYTTGLPGVMTNLMHASFDNFAVYSN